MFMSVIIIESVKILLIEVTIIVDGEEGFIVIIELLIFMRDEFNIWGISSHPWSISFRVRCALL